MEMKIISMMWCLRPGFLLMLLLLADSSSGNTDWFDCGTQHSCKIFIEPKNWHDAEAACNAEFGHLASIVSIAEDRDPIANKSAEIGVTDYWIGLNHLGGLQDHWRFTDGEPVNSSMWTPGYPLTRDPYGLIEMCGVESRNHSVTAVGTVGFRNEHCDRYNQFVCKKLNGTREPISPTTTKAPPEESYCPTGYTAISSKGKPNMGNKCFKFVFLNDTNGVDWNEAVKRCRVPGIKSDIASIHGPYEHEFIRSQMVNRTFGLWIGLHRASIGQGWVWVDNSAFTREDNHWSDGLWSPHRRWGYYFETRDSQQGGDCVEAMSIPNAAKWNAVQCDQRRGYICQTYKDSDNPITDPPPSPGHNCLDGYTPYQHGCYRLLSNTQKSWAEMRDECRSHSSGKIRSDLVSIHSSAEDATLHIIVMQSGESAWIGFKENKVNTFQWSNGWYPTYTNWRATQDGDDGNLGCVAMGNGTDGGWYELNCTTPLAGICKTTVEEPTIAPLVKNGSCPDEQHGSTSWLKHGSYCYLPVSEYKTWHEARLHCAKYGTTSNLVSIHSESENTFVLENMPKPVSWTTLGWIGLYRHTKDDGFYWADGSPFQYEKWNLGEPNSNGDDDEDCSSMYIQGHDRFHWYGERCGNHNPFMCKVEQGSPLEPPQEHEGTCPDGWHKFGASCYLPFPESYKWWHQAEEDCQREGGKRAHLATITNKLQSDFINDIMAETSSFEVHNPYWIGLNQRRGEHIYNWVGTGEEYKPTGYQMFPTATIVAEWGRASCVIVRQNRYGDQIEWRTEGCEQTASFVCELPLDAEGLPPGEISGIVIGVLAAVVFFSLMVVCFRRRQCIIDIRKTMDDTKKIISFSNQNYDEEEGVSTSGVTKAAFTIDNYNGGQTSFSMVTL